VKRNGRFWWFVTVIALAHLGAILLVSRWALAAQEPQPQSITWLSGGGAPAMTTRQRSLHPRRWLPSFRQLPQNPR